MGVQLLACLADAVLATHAQGPLPCSSTQTTQDTSTHTHRPRPGTPHAHATGRGTQVHGGPKRGGVGAEHGGGTPFLHLPVSGRPRPPLGQRARVGRDVARHTVEDARGRVWGLDVPCVSTLDLAKACRLQLVDLPLRCCCFCGVTLWPVCVGGGRGAWTRAGSVSVCACVVW